MSTSQRRLSARSMTLRLGPPLQSGRKRSTGTMTGWTTQTCIGSQWVRVHVFLCQRPRVLIVFTFYLVLHPRHKLNYFQRTGWPSEWIATAKKMVRDEYDNNYRFRGDMHIIPGPQDTKETLSAKNVFDNLPAFRPIEIGTFDELTWYIASEPEDVKNEDLLRWWVEHRHVYPHLTRMALDYHTVPCEFHFVLISLYLTISNYSQVRLLTWSEYSVKADFFYPTLATASLRNQREHFCASVTGADTVS